MNISTGPEGILTEVGREMLSNIADEMRVCVDAIDESELGYAKDILLECIRALELELELDKMYLSYLNKGTF